MLDPQALVQGLASVTARRQGDATYTGLLIFICIVWLWVVSWVGESILMRMLGGET
jgi:hypothetical protein